MMVLDGKNRSEIVKSTFGLVSARDRWYHRFGVPIQVGVSILMIAHVDSCSIERALTVK